MVVYKPLAEFKWTWVHATSGMGAGWKLMGDKLPDKLLAKFKIALWACLHVDCLATAC
jgi:hypothetical protein